MNVTELRAGAVFKEDQNVFQVLTYEHNKTGRGSGNIRVKVRNFKTGAVIEKTFITGARVDDAIVEKTKAQYLYQDGEGYAFMDPVSYEQFSVAKAVIGDQAKFLQEGMEVILLIMEGEALGIELPISLVYSITETGPGERGNTVSNVFKEATLDNGLVVKVPMFMKVGEKVKVDTRSGAYIERVK
jgi:elongation factor P